MEYAKHGSLDQYMRQHAATVKDSAKEITKQLLAGLEVLHQQDIPHPGLKTQVCHEFLEPTGERTITLTIQ